MPAVAGKGVHCGSYYALLDCLHENIYSVGEPTVGDEVWCAKCYGYTRILHVAGKYGVRCHTCRYARNYGGELTAKTKATSHSLRHLGHRVTLTYPEGAMEEFHNVPQTFDFDTPPF